jgi:hypothetical protein
MTITVKRIFIVTVGGLVFWAVMEKLGVYAKIEKMI